ncbi:MAG: hypothetical protein R3290_12205, partial [Acidimicrobiia bacterium]|nr:hypothetical protein [Acidimicrobiia bacterium]
MSGVIHPVSSSSAHAAPRPRLRLTPVTSATGAAVTASPYPCRLRACRTGVRRERRRLRRSIARPGSEPMDEGTIVVLNGTSSAGKSTIAGERPRTGDAPMLHLSLDLVSEMVPDGFFVMSADEVDPP